jgi:hypothetical protein
MAKIGPIWSPWLHETIKVIVAVCRPIEVGRKIQLLEPILHMYDFWIYNYVQSQRCGKYVAQNIIVFKMH